MNRSQRSRQSFTYDSLEPKNLLAGVTIIGTPGDDVLTIEVIRKGNLVNITLNGELTENVDIRDGLLIDLGAGQNSTTIDNIGLRLNTPTIEIQNTNQLQFIDGNNLWRIQGNFPIVRTADSVGGLFGTVNNNIFFSGAMRLIGGSEVDTFNIYSFQAGVLMGGDGNDIFRFGRGEMGTSGARVMGGAGDDFFAVHGENITDLYGGDGNDRLSFISSDLESLELSLDVENKPTWSVAGGNIDVERIDGLPDGVNSVSNSGWSQRPRTIKWVMDGRFTRAIPAESGQTLRMVDFFDFDLNHYTTDNFYVRSTAADVTIKGASLVQFSSTINLTNGNLDGIMHDVTIQPGHNPDILRQPHVILSNQTGQGSSYSFANNSISGLSGGGHVRFEGFEPLSNGKIGPSLIEIYGSDTEADRFIFLDVWAAETVAYGLGGDDTFFIEGPGLDSFSQTQQRTISLIGGEGEDRIVVNDRGATPRPTLSPRHWVRSYTIRDQTISWMFRTRSEIASTRGPLVNFDDTTEIVRINGSANYQNIFDVYPDTMTRIVVDALEQTEFDDMLRIHEADGTLIPGDHDDGVWVFDDGIQPVFFYGIEDTYEV